MTLAGRWSLLLVAVFGMAALGQAQDVVDPTPPVDPEASAETTVEKAEGALESAGETVEAYADAVDRDPKAQEVSAGILNPIYQLAEALRFEWFHWIAFATMAAGVVSFALQLTLGKLVVLSKLGFSVTEILSDALGLAVSVVGLVLTTQAAAENSTFTQSAFAVLSAAITGVVVGIIFYLWGQRQELQATEGRRVRAVVEETRVR